MICCSSYPSSFGPLGKLAFVQSRHLHDRISESPLFFLIYIAIY